jgi:hypothetical protein
MPPTRASPASRAGPSASREPACAVSPLRASVPDARPALAARIESVSSRRSHSVPRLTPLLRVRRGARACSAPPAARRRVRRDAALAAFLSHGCRRGYYASRCRCAPARSRDRCARPRRIPGPALPATRPCGRARTGCPLGASARDLGMSPETPYRAVAKARELCRCRDGLEAERESFGCPSRRNRHDEIKAQARSE